MPLPAAQKLFISAIRQWGVALSHTAKGEYRLWQRRYWEHIIRDENSLQRHVNYVHNDPAKHGLVKRAVD